MKNFGVRRVVAMLWMLGAAAALPACGDEKVETACCQLLRLCDECFCSDSIWTLATAGEPKACKFALDEADCTSVGYSKSRAEQDCTE